ncbi:DUF4439 domain-containing protein [Nocardiopsis sp. CNT312]|uniref:DUF4439 domain-containing protein n=1 Tax=Nocardiopsis sp. CNT312 TaxID=1137268 RepID=UPI00048C33E3|nr:DUF4439 domain-containing protein [Nocardiopsis sp. CNT312]
MSETPAPVEGARTAEGTGVAEEALAEALGAEHAAVYGYEFVRGAAGDEQRRDRALTHMDHHRETRDALHAAAVERGFGPTPARPAYPLPEERGDAVLDGYAVGLERAAARACLWLSASGDAGLRALAARALQEAAVRALVWGGELDALPGFDEA